MYFFIAQGGKILSAGLAYGDVDSHVTAQSSKPGQNWFARRTSLLLDKSDAMRYVFVIYLVLLSVIGYLYVSLFSATIRQVLFFFLRLYTYVLCHKISLKRLSDDNVSL